MLPMGNLTPSTRSESGEPVEQCGIVDGAAIDDAGRVAALEQPLERDLEFLPVRVWGMPGAATISSGTCRGDAFSRISVRIRLRSASSSSHPSARTTNNGIQ